MIQRIIASCLALLCLLLPMQVQAAETDTQRLCSLTLSYSKDGVGFEGLPVTLYRVADADPDGTFALISPFDAFPVNIYGITSQKEWQETASTLVAYITAQQVPATVTGVTDQAGEIRFTDLPTGLYLVRGIRTQNEKDVYVFSDFMIYLPTPQEDGSLNYDLHAKPKCQFSAPADEYSVIKLWKDADDTKRPQSITVDIYKNGELYDTVNLSESNGWYHQWSDADNAEWHVIEQNVPDGYEVTISAQGTTFTILNTNPDAPPSPETGNSFSIQWWILLLCIAGFAMVVLSLWGNKYEKAK